MFCPNCGNQVSDTAKFCGKCGAQTQAAPGAGTQQQITPTHTMQPGAQIPPPPPTFPEQQSQQGYTGAPHQAYTPGAAAPEGSIDAMDCIRTGWNMTMPNIGVFILSALILTAIQFGLSVIPIVGNLAGIFLLPLNAGLLIMSFKVMNGAQPEIADLFAGFRRYGDLLLVQLIAGIFIGLGFILLIVPGVFLAVCYTMALPLVVDRGMGFWDAMSLSMKEVRKQWGAMFVLGLLMILVVLAGVIALGVGVLVAIPVCTCALAVAYSRIFAVENRLP